MAANPFLVELLLVRPDAVGAATKIHYRAGDMLVRSGARLECVFFPSRGLLASTVVAESARIEVGYYGRRGVVGGTAAFGATTHVTDCICDVAGSAWSLPSRMVTEACDAHQSLRHLFFQHEQFMLIQAQYKAACNAKHSIRARSAARLLAAFDFCEEYELRLTQERFAEMLGVQRASVSHFASEFKDNGLIEYTRGRIRVTDEVGLLSEACECCTALRIQAGRLLPKDSAADVQVAQQIASSFFTP